MSVDLGMQFPSLGIEDPLGEEMATHSQYSCLENPINRGVWQAIVHRVAKSQSQLSTQARTLVGESWTYGT